jgi:cell division septation protein DedD
MTAEADTAPESAPANPVVAFTAPAEENVEVAGTVDEVEVPEVIEADSAPMRVAGDHADAAGDDFVVEDGAEGEWVAADEAIAAAAPPQPSAVPAPAPVVVPAAAPARTAVAPRAGHYVVQIGAFTEEANVSAAWDRAVGRYAELAQYEPRRTVFQHGQTYYRLSFGGFDDWSEANGLCRSLKARGQQCFVRARVDGAPTQMAAAVSSGDGWFAGHLRTEVASRDTENSGWFA